MLEGDSLELDCTIRTDVNLKPNVQWTPALKNANSILESVTAGNTYQKIQYLLNIVTINKGKFVTIKRKISN